MDQVAALEHLLVKALRRICKMNMLLHGISHADIRQEDTIR
jgi:type I restriction enzyme M protein